MVQWTWLLKGFIFQFGFKPISMSWAVGMIPPPGVPLTLYVCGSCGIRFKINVVLPLPRKPVMIVTGVGAMFSENGRGFVKSPVRPGGNLATW